jgi:hypothetical protein
MLYEKDSRIVKLVVVEIAIIVIIKVAYTEREIPDA